MLCIAPAGAITFSAADEFSPALNPSGVWTYGWSTALGTPFVRSEINGVVEGLDYWAGPVAEPSRPGRFPLVIDNGTDHSIFAFGTVVIGSGVLAMHPGPTGEYAVLRFTAPSAGSYSLSSAFSGIDIRPTSTDVHVLVNGTSIFNGSVAAFGSGPSFGALINLPLNGTIDLAVGPGAYNDFFFDSTAVNLSVAEVAGPVTGVPEPATASLLLVGALALGASRRRWRNPGGR
jgi:hypothetical protein